MVAWCRVLRKYSFLRAGTFPDILWPCRASPCWAKASPKAGPFGRTTSRAPSFSSTVRPVHTWETLGHGIAAPVRQLSFHDERESDAYRQTTCNLDRAAALQSLRH